MKRSGCNIVRVLRILPLVSLIGWVATFASRYGLTASGASIQTIAFATVLITTAIAFVSGVYPLPRLRRRERDAALTRIDWVEFDRVRELWRRHQHH